MTPLSTWLRAQMKERSLNQTALSKRAGVAAGTLNDILRKGHIPKVETLTRLATALDASPVEALLVSGHLRSGDQLLGDQTAQPGRETEANLEWRLIQEVRRVLPEDRPGALAEFRTIVRTLKRPRYRLVGGEEADPIKAD